MTGTDDTTVRLRVGVVATTTEHGGAEAHIAHIWTQPTVRARTDVRLLGGLPQWEATGLPATDLGFGAKWSYRRALTSVLRMPATVLGGRRTVAALHDESPFDVFYAHFKREQVLLTRGLARVAPVVWMEHGHFPTGRLRRPLLAAYRRAARHVAVIVCVSESVRCELGELLGRHAPPIEVIENAIDPDWLVPPDPTSRTEARRSFGIPDDAELVLAVVGRLIPRKRVALAIDAAEQLPGSWLIVCGEGPLDAELRAQAAGNPRVVFTGFLTDTRPVYRAADVTLLISWEEGYGSVLLESAAAGVPAVVSADGGFPERVAAWGAVAATATPEAVADAIIEATHVPTTAPRRWAEQHGRAAWARRHLDVVERVVER